MEPKLVGVLAGVFGALTALLLLLGTFVAPVALVVAVPFGVTAYFLWYHASGRLADRVYAEATFDGGRRERTRRERRRERASRPPRERPSRAAAYRTLGLEPGADDAAVRAAYRERVKEVHPDSGGDEEAFREVRAAYERLGGDV